MLMNALMEHIQQNSIGVSSVPRDVKLALNMMNALHANSVQISVMVHVFLKFVLKQINISIKSLGIVLNVALYARLAKILLQIVLVVTSDGLFISLPAFLQELDSSQLFVKKGNTMTRLYKNVSTVLKVA